MQRREETIDPNSFERRHIGPNEEEVRAMLREVGFEDLDSMVEAAVPRNIRLERDLNLPEAKSEMEALAELRAISRKNRSRVHSSAVAIPIALRRRSFSEIFWKTRVGTLLTHPIRLNSRKAGLKPSSIFKP